MISLDILIKKNVMNVVVPQFPRRNFDFALPLAIGPQVREKDANLFAGR